MWKKRIIKGSLALWIFLVALHAGVSLQAAETGWMDGRHPDSETAKQAEEEEPDSDMTEEEILYSETVERIEEEEPDSDMTEEEILYSDTEGQVIQGSVQSEADLEEIAGILDFSELDRFLEEEDQPGFSEYIKKCISGEWEFDIKGLWESFKNLVLGSFEKSRDTLIQILILSIAFSVLHNFANTFQNSQVSVISYYMVYLVLMVLLMRSFMAVNDLVVTALKTVMGFMNCLMPTFTMALVFSNGQASALGFYEIALIIIYLVEYAVIYLLVPAVRLYVVLIMLNHIATEEILSNLTALIRSGISWALKILLTFVIGLNVIQGLLGPALDQYKRSFMSKGLSAIPGVGNTVQSVSELILGTGMVIRNSVGVAALAILVILCASPCIQMAVMALFYKLAAAVMEPVTDKRISSAVAGVGSGVMLLFKSLLTVIILFFITIAVICVASGVIV